MQQIRKGEIKGIDFLLFVGLYTLGQQLTDTSRTISESELHVTKVLCTFFKQRLSNGFKAPPHLVNFVAVCDMRSDEPVRGF